MKKQVEANREKQNLNLNPAFCTLLYKKNDNPSGTEKYLYTYIYKFRTNNVEKIESFLFAEVKLLRLQTLEKKSFY